MNEQFQRCIEACYLCATACDNCATSCLQEEHVEMMRDCIRYDIQCAAICRVSAQLMAQKSEYAAQLCKL